MSWNKHSRKLKFGHIFDSNTDALKHMLICDLVLRTIYRNVTVFVKENRHVAVYSEREFLSSLRECLSLH